MIEISHGWLVMPVSKYLISTTFALLPPTSYKLDIWIKAALVELQKYNVILLMVEKVINMVLDITGDMRQDYHMVLLYIV